MKVINAAILLKKDKKERVKILLDIIKGKTKFYEVEDRTHNGIREN